MDEKTKLFLERTLQLQIRLIQEVGKLAAECMMGPEVRLKLLEDLHELLTQTKKAKDLL